MANTNDSFIDEVAEAVRRDRLTQWFRRWGWLVALAVAAIVGVAAFSEWQESRREAAAKARGDAILSALEESDQAARAAALSELPRQGAENVVAAMLVAAEQLQVDDPEGAAETLNAVAADGDVPPLWRDLAALKAQMALGDAADRAALEALAAPGAPFRLLALEEMALLDLGQDRRDEAVATLEAIGEDAEVTPAQAQRVAALLRALGADGEG